VSGLPWRGRTERRAHRNNVTELAAYLDANMHSYIIFNLVPFEVGAQYNYDAFGGQVCVVQTSSFHHHPRWH